MKHIKLIMVLSIVALVTIVIGVTFSKWSIRNEQVEINTLNIGCLETSIVESESISMTNAYPVTDYDGLNGTPYTFSLENKCEEAQSVQINLESFATTASFDASQIRYSFTGSAPDFVSSLPTMNPILNNATNGYILTTDTIDAGTTHEYDLRLWIDENQTVENATNKIFKTRISIITSYGK